MKEIIIAGTYGLKQISGARNNTGKTDAGKPCRTIKTRILSGERLISPVTVHPKEIQDLRGMFTTYRMSGKRNTRLKNRIHPLLKEQLYGFTREEIFGKKSRAKIREIPSGPALKYQLNLLMDRPGRDEIDAAALKERVLPAAAPFMKQTGILTSLKGVSVFTAVAIIAGIIDVSGFKDAKHLTSYPHSAPHVAASNTSAGLKGTNKKGRKVSAALLTRSLNHVLDANLKLRKRHQNLCEYRKAGLVRSALRLSVFAEIYRMLKKGEYHYCRDANNHKAKTGQYRRLLKKQNIAYENFLAKTA